ncbi:MAG: DNA translocase FtsK 4TM domain-containing protein [Pseudomonadota bacterium]
MNRLREIIVIAIIGLALFFLLALASYHSTDSSWSHVGAGATRNLTGVVGAWIADITFVLTGYVSFMLPFLMAAMAVMQWKNIHNIDEKHNALWLRVVGLLVFVLMATSLLSLYLKPFSIMPAGSGGVIGSIIGQILLKLINITGSSIFLMVGLLSGLTLCLDISWLKVADAVGRAVFAALNKLWQRMPRLTLAHLKSSSQVPKLPEQEEEEDLPEIMPMLQARTPTKKSVPPVSVAPVITDYSPPPKIVEKVIIEKAVAEKAEVIEKAPKPAKPKPASPSLPVNGDALLSLELLNPPEHLSQNRMSETELTMLSQEVEQRLLDFGIKVEVVAAHPGPVITRFELLPAPGIKASRITNLAMDLARSLSVRSVRIVEVIPGKAVVGLEIPNRVREVVYLKEVLESKPYQEAKSPLSLALGKDIAGYPVVVDLAKMPHLLVAGTTGAGKSVGLNAMLLSLLYKATPAEVRLIMVDPKMLELSIYEGIPHLLTPVVTDMKEAANALRWCVAEMEKRYRLMATQGVRNIGGYNEKVSEAKKNGEPIKAPEWYASSVENGELTTLPMIVVVIDEFADMIMVVGKKVEQLIARIAQKARAAGIHLILATQRPSVNVITGLIKANIPTRIAFQVSSKIDSRTILDQQGAQQLLGHGDMLYLAPGAGVPVRVHGAFVADEEVHRVVAAWRAQGDPDYLELGLQQHDSDDGDSGSGMGDDEDAENDKLYDQAVQIVLETRKASISGVQRRLRIGYNRAARLIESMENAGLVGPMEQNGSREVYAPNA